MKKLHVAKTDNTQNDVGIKGLCDAKTQEDKTEMPI